MNDDSPDLRPEDSAPPAGGAPRWKILVVDDAAEIRSVTRLVLSRLEFAGRRLELLDAGSAAEARDILAEEEDIALVLLDVVMETEDAGLVLAREIREEMGNRLTRVVIRTGQPGMAPEQDVILGYDISGYVEKTELTSRKLVTTVVASLRDYGRLVGLEKARAESEGTTRDLADILGEVLESRSRETANHVRRVGEYSRRLALLAGLPAAEAELLRVAAPLHDIGKIGIAEAIISKPGSLNPVERRVVEGHAEIGYRILSRSDRPLLRVARAVALAHHEHWDGSGYPRGLQGEAIDIHARVVAVADVFDALLCRRAYKESWDENRALDYLRAESGRVFDPRLVELFLADAAGFLELWRAFPDPPAEPPLPGER